MINVLAARTLTNFPASIFSIPIATMSDVALVKSLLGVHPDFPKKVGRRRLAREGVRQILTSASDIPQGIVFLDLFVRRKPENGRALHTLTLIPLPTCSPSSETRLHSRPSSPT